MTDDEKALDKASKYSSLAVLGMTAATAFALFGPPFFFPLVAVPMVAMGVVQRLTERPWIAGAAAAWGFAIAAIWQSPVVAVGAAAAGAFFVRHWLLYRKLDRKTP